jgi:hypothetical protein
MQQYLDVSKYSKGSRGLDGTPKVGGLTSGQQFAPRTQFG